MRQEPKETQIDEDTIVQWLTEDEREDDKEEQNTDRGQEGNRRRGVKGAGQAFAAREQRP